MRLLICTQKVDKNDSVLGFFHRWIEEFATHCDSVLVLCLSKGEVSLPENVHVYSLGKEKGRGRIGISYQLLLNIWARRSEYDSVFVHMNPEYLVFGGPIWRLLKKPVALWYNHKKGSLLLKLTAWLPRVIFYTSPGSYSARYRKAVQAPVGVDTDFFKPVASQSPPINTILFLGRISPVKHVEQFVDGLLALEKRGVNFQTTIVGDILPVDSTYGSAMKRQAALLLEKGKLKWQSGVPFEKTRGLYAAHALYVNLTPSGSFDKTIAEAMAVGALPIVCNEVLRDAIPAPYLLSDEQSSTIADALEQALKLSENDRSRMATDMRQYVVEAHSLDRLIADLCRRMAK